MRTHGIILKTQTSGENDILVTCYTAQAGKITAVAKSALKPTSLQSMQLNTLNLIDFELVDGRAWPIITGAQTERTYPGIRSSLPALAVASFFLEAFEKLVFEHQEDSRLWDFLSGFLDRLETASPALDFFRTHQLQLLQTLGYAPTEDHELLTQIGPVYSQLDVKFEQLSGARYASLPFLYSTVRV